MPLSEVLRVDMEGLAVDRLLASSEDSSGENVRCEMERPLYDGEPCGVVEGRGVAPTDNASIVSWNSPGW